MSPHQLLPQDNNWAWALATQPELLRLVRAHLVRWAWAHACHCWHTSRAHTVAFVPAPDRFHGQGDDIVLFSSQLTNKPPGGGTFVPWWVGTVFRRGDGVWHPVLILISSFIAAVSSHPLYVGLQRHQDGERCRTLWLNLVGWRAVQLRRAFINPWVRSPPAGHITPKDDVDAENGTLRMKPGWYRRCVSPSPLPPCRHRIATTKARQQGCAWPLRRRLTRPVHSQRPRQV